MIYCIHNFNPEQVIAINYSKNKLILKAMMIEDKFSRRNADLVVTVGRDLVDTLKKRFRNKNIPNHVMINNWIDEKEAYPLPPDDERVMAFKKKYGLENKFVIMYSGNIGLYYDLLKLAKVLKQFRRGYNSVGMYFQGPKTTDGRGVMFAFVGEGSVKSELQAYVERHKFENVVFIPYQKKEDLIYSLNAADVHWCVNAPGIKGVSVPSKVYGIMGVGKPILGVLEEGSEARMLIEEAGCGLCCEPGDYVDVADEIRWFIDHAGAGIVKEMGENGRAYLEKNLTKNVSIHKYIEAIKAL